MSDDGTNAAKKIAYTIAAEGDLAKLKYELDQMLTYAWYSDDLVKIRNMAETVDHLLTDARDLVDSYYKVIGEA
jgi:hypothetical protein